MESERKEVFSYMILLCSSPACPVYFIELPARATGAGQTFSELIQSFLLKDFTSDPAILSGCDDAFINASFKNPTVFPDCACCGTA